jgi:hypothetical protein
VASKKVARKSNAAFMQPMFPSPTLAVIVGKEAQPRTEIVRKIWAYIKRKGLQDPVEKRNINADAALRAVFGGLRAVSMYEMTQLVNDSLSGVPWVGPAPARTKAGRAKQPTRAATSPKSRRLVPYSFGAVVRPRVSRAEAVDPLNTLAQQEKAVRAHQNTLEALAKFIELARWTNLEVEPTGIDLRATDPDGRRTIFEVKTLGGGMERDVVRSGLAQLLEYRYLSGSADDRLCLVTDFEVSADRRRFLESLAITTGHVEKGSVALRLTSGKRAVRQA